MAETQHSAGAAHDSRGERPLTVELNPHGLDFWEYHGTRAQLEAEGIVPAAIAWPAAGAQSVGWQDGRLKFSLRRIRPDGLRGPMRLWVNGDWWALRCDLIGGPDMLQRRLICMQRALELETYRQSPAGQRAWYAAYKRLRAADCDRAFQAFKALVPGLIPPRRGRRAGGAAGAAGDAAG
jgi:hypothetical protein